MNNGSSKRQKTERGSTVGSVDLFHPASPTVSPGGNSRRLDAGVSPSDEASVSSLRSLGRTIRASSENQHGLADVLLQRNSMYQQQQARLSNPNFRRIGIGIAHRRDKAHSILSPLQHHVPAASRSTKSDDIMATIQGVPNLEMERQVHCQEELLVFQDRCHVGASDVVPTLVNDIPRDRHLRMMMSRKAAGRQHPSDSSPCLHDLAATREYLQLAERANSSLALEGLLGNAAQQHVLSPSSPWDEPAVLQRQQIQQQELEEQSDALIRLLLRQKQRRQQMALMSSTVPQRQVQLEIQNVQDQIVHKPRVPPVAGLMTTEIDYKLGALLQVQNFRIRSTETSLLSQGGLLSPPTSSTYDTTPSSLLDWKHPSQCLLQQQHREQPLSRMAQERVLCTRINTDEKYAEDCGNIEGSRPGRNGVGLIESKFTSSIDPVEAVPKDAFKDRDVNGRATSLPTLLAMPSDRSHLSEHQTLLRYQVEVFGAEEEDVATHTKGRNKPVELGQIGVRCRHCKILPVSERLRGSVYFPRTVEGFYQAVQHMNSIHLQSGECQCMGDKLRKRFAELVAYRGSSNGAGRSYWERQARALGLENTDDGILFVGKKQD